MRVCSAVSDSLLLPALSPTRLLCPWDSPGNNTGVGCHALLQGIFVTQGLNTRLLCLLRLLHWQAGFLPQVPAGKPICSHKLVQSVQFSHSVVSNSLRPHEPQHTRPPCPSPTPGVHSNSCPSRGDAIQPSHPLSSPFPSSPNPSKHQSLFQ